MTEMVIKWGLIKRCGSVSATPALRKTRNPYFLIIHPHSIELSDNLTLAVIPLECQQSRKNPDNTHLYSLFSDQSLTML